MSVILDALQKARGDKQKDQVEPHPNSVARVLDPSTPAGLEVQPPRSRGLGLAVAVIVGVILIITLAGGAFFLLYDQMLRLQNQTLPAVATPVLAGTQAATGTGAAALETELAVPAALPTPLPEAELPIQTPATIGANQTVPSASNGAVDSGSNSPSAQAAPAALVPTDPGFKLGSIVCENNICMALINGRTVREGERVKDYTVARITDKGVVLKSVNGSDEIFLDLYN